MKSPISPKLLPVSSQGKKVAVDRVAQKAVFHLNIHLTEMNYLIADKSIDSKLGRVAHTCNLSTQVAEAGGLP